MQTLNPALPHSNSKDDSVPARTEARQLFDSGLTVGQVAADLGVTRSTADYLTRMSAPVWPVLSEDIIARLPKHLQAIARQTRNR